MGDCGEDRGMSSSGLFSRMRGTLRRSGPVPIIGFVRFSVLFGAQDFFSEMKDKSPEERRAILFDPARMDDRFRYFEALTLPSLTAQQDDDWRAVIFYSTELPPAYRDRLLDLVATHTHLEPVAYAPDQKLAAELRRQVAAYIPDPPGLHAGFRLDDDDGLANTFIARLRELLTEYGREGTGISFSAGHLLKAEPGGAGFRLAETVRNFAVGCGLTLVTDGKAGRDIFHLGRPHRRIDEAFPTIADAREPMFICSAHARNDSGTGSLRHAKLERSEVLDAAEVRSRLGPSFAHLDLAKLAGAG